MRERKQNLTQAGAILLLSSVAVKLIGALFKIPLASDAVLGDLGFGYFSGVYDMYTPIYTLALSGFPVAISRIVADFTAKGDTEGVKSTMTVSFKALLVLGVTGAFFLGACALPIAFFTDESGGSTYSLWVIAPAVLFCSLMSVYRGYFEGVKNMLPTAISNIIEALCKLVLGLGLAFIIMKATGKPALAAAGAMLGITLGTALAFVYLVVTYKKRKIVRGECRREMLCGICAVAIPVAIASLSVGFPSLIDAVTLRRQLGEMLAENPLNAEILLRDTSYTDIALEEIPTLIYGIKGKAHTLFNLIPTFTVAFGVGAIPIITECFVKGDRQGLIKNTNQLLKLSALISFPACAGFLGLGKEIMALLYGEASAVLGGKLLAIYGISALFGGMAVTTTALLQGLGKQKSALYNILIGMAAKVICNLCLTPVLNVYACVWGTAVCFGIIAIFNMLLCFKALGERVDCLNCFLKPLVAAICCFITAVTVKNILNGSLGTLLTITVSAVIYVLFVVVLRAVSRDDILEAVKK